MVVSSHFPHCACLNGIRDEPVRSRVRPVQSSAASRVSPPYSFYLLLPLMSDLLRLRIGFGMTMSSFALLIGNPISGALLDEPRYKWDRPIIFNAVSFYFCCLRT